MGEENKVIVYGAWGSPFVKRVELALKLKGISYEYVEEDLMNKSPLLLHYNPVHKKVPVLVHNGNPIAESFLIIEYINETWNDSPHLLPQDPYKRAKVRFWANYIQQKLFDTMFLVITTEGEAQEKAIKEVRENLKVLEDEGMKDLFPEGICRIKNAGLADIVMSSLFSPHKVQEEVIGVRVIDEEKTPLIFSWIQALNNEVPAVKEVLPPPQDSAALLRLLRQKYLQPSTA